MARKKWILILAAFLAAAQQIHAACVCKEKGEDACASCSGMVRPKPNHPKRPEFELPPAGDSCWCSKKLIEPASLPKPCSKHKQQPCGCRCRSAYHTPHYNVPQVNYQHAVAKDYSLPADPISVSLAVQAGKAIEVPEAKLAYGFVRKPLNGLPKIYVSSVKEENLYALANDVITLKKPLAPKTKKMEEDYPEPEEEEPANEYYEPPSLTYKQLGYAPEDFKNPAFIPVPSLGDLPIPLPKKGGLECGFKPGRIAEIKHKKNCGHFDCAMKYY